MSLIGATVRGWPAAQQVSLYKSNGALDTAFINIIIIIII